MQTFMPMVGYEESMRELDDARLNKQILEAVQIVNVLIGETAGYRNHPAVIMWHGHVANLCSYGIIAAQVWSERTGRSPLERIAWFYQMQVWLASNEPVRVHWRSTSIPPWVGDNDFHMSHRSRLEEKDPNHYQWPGTFKNMPYLWPVNREDYDYDLKVSKADMKRLELGERVLPEHLQVDQQGFITEVE